MGSAITMVGAIIGSLVCGSSCYFAGYTKGASEWFDEIEDHEATTILTTSRRAPAATSLTSKNVPRPSGLAGIPALRCRAIFEKWGTGPNTASHALCSV